MRPFLASVRLLFDLAKARLLLLVLFTTAIGFFLANPETIDWLRLLSTLAGTALAAAGVGALNQAIEAKNDARMERTRQRPIPSGRISLPAAVAIGIVSTIAGIALLTIAVNLLSAALALAAAVIYILAYTPLKTRTSLCTLVGALVGAAPPMIGWAASAEALQFGAWTLGAMLFLWQIPHFLTLGWVHRKDYATVGFRVLPADDPTGQVTSRISLLYTLALVPTALLAPWAGIAGVVYTIGAVLFGLALLTLALKLHTSHTPQNAQRLFWAGLLYLPVLLALMALDPGPPISRLASPPIGSGTEHRAPPLTSTPQSK